MYYEGDVTAEPSCDVIPVARAVHPLFCKVTSTARATFVGGQRCFRGPNPRHGKSRVRSADGQVQPRTTVVKDRRDSACV